MPLQIFEITLGGSDTPSEIYQNKSFSTLKYRWIWGKEASFECQWEGRERNGNDLNDIKIFRDGEKTLFRT